MLIREEPHQRLSLPHAARQCESRSIDALSGLASARRLRAHPPSLSRTAPSDSCRDRSCRKASFRCPPVFTSASPAFKLPRGTYATKPDAGFRNSLCPKSSETSITRSPIGSLAPPAIGHQHPSLRLCHRNGIRLHHPNPLLRLQRCKILRRCPALLGSRRLRHLDHPVRWAHARLRAAAQIVPEIRHLLFQIRHGQPRQALVLRPSQPARLMAMRACVDIRPASRRDYCRHRRMRPRQPVGSNKQIHNLRLRITRAAPRNMFDRFAGGRCRVSCWQRPTGADRIGPDRCTG